MKLGAVDSRGSTFDLEVEKLLSMVLVAATISDSVQGVFRVLRSERIWVDDLYASTVCGAAKTLCLAVRQRKTVPPPAK